MCFLFLGWLWVVDLVFVAGVVFYGLLSSLVCLFGFLMVVWVDWFCCAVCGDFAWCGIMFVDGCLGACILCV